MLVEVAATLVAGADAWVALGTAADKANPTWLTALDASPFDGVTAAGVTAAGVTAEGETAARETAAVDTVDADRLAGCTTAGEVVTARDCKLVAGVTVLWLFK